MKLIATLLLAALPSLSFAHDHDHGSTPEIIAKSPLAQATAAALELFESAPKGSLYSFKSGYALDEVASEVLYIDNGAALRLSKYDCHFHLHGNEQEAHCHDVIDEASNSTPPTSLKFAVDDFVTSLAGALDIFARKVAPIETVTQLKMWQAADAMYVNLNFENAGTTGSSYYMCHIHGGAEIDCHRSLKPGPQEPAF